MKTQIRGYETLFFGNASPIERFSSKMGSATFAVDCFERLQSFRHSEFQTNHGRAQCFGGQHSQ